MDFEINLGACHLQHLLYERIKASLNLEKLLGFETNLELLGAIMIFHTI